MPIETQVVTRSHPAETGDSAAVSCPVCNGSKHNPQYPDQPCSMCVGTGFLLQQRMDSQGRAVRVSIKE